MTKSKINGQSLVKVEDLLESCFEATENLLDECNEQIQKLKEKIREMKVKQEIQDTKFANTQLRYGGVKKNGRLGEAGKPNWEWANSEISQRIEVLADKPVTPQEEIQVCEEIVGIVDWGTSVTTHTKTQDGLSLQQNKEAWVECVMCSKWRIIPRGVEAPTW
jgi:hypothetical protein